MVLLGPCSWSTVGYPTLTPGFSLTPDRMNVEHLARVCWNQHLVETRMCLREMRGTFAVQIKFHHPGLKEDPSDDIKCVYSTGQHWQHLDHQEHALTTSRSSGTCIYVTVLTCSAWASLQSCEHIKFHMEDYRTATGTRADSSPKP